MAPKHFSAPAAHFEPRTSTQRMAQRLYHQSDILFLLGPAGAGKSLCAMAFAACDVLAYSSPRQMIICVRPAVQADRQLGHLPGTLEEKLEPYTAPLKQSLAKVTFRFPVEKIRYEALGYVRGLTWDRSVVVVDESQNLTHRQLVLLISRLGQDSKLIVTGDPDQADIGTTGSYHTDLEEVVDQLEGVKGVGVIDFPDEECHRHPVLTRVLPKLRRG